MNPQPEQKEPTHTTIRKGKIFEDEESVRRALRVDDKSVEGPWQLVTIRRGLHVAAFRVNPEVMHSFDFDVEEMPMSFAFYLSGRLEGTLNKGRGRKPISILGQRGVNSIICLRGAKGHSQYLSHETLNAVAIYVDPQMFTDLIAKELDGISKDTRHLLQQKNSFFSLPMTGEMYNVATRALYHPYHGTAARLHLEACGLELLALQLDRFSRDMHREKPLCRADEERIRMAADILVRQMESPPTISALAVQVGVSSTKLKKGFKQIFGTSIGQFLLQHRMTCARELIVNRQLDVTQAAFSVGYSNVSHFIHYYKKMFGVTPPPR